MDRENDSECPRIAILQRFWLDDLGRIEHQQVENHVQECEKCSSAIEILEKERRIFLKKYPPELIERQVLAEVERRIQSRKN